ncbi:MAG: hypothetical protein VB997_05920 [Opitutales bacterium]
MSHELPVLLDRLGSRKTVEDRLELIRDMPDEDTCTFTFAVREIRPWIWFAGNEKFRGGKTVFGELVDKRPEDKMEYLHDQSGQQLQLALPKRWNNLVSHWEKGEEIHCSGHLLGWDATSERYQLLATEIPGSSEAHWVILAWILKIVFAPIWVPCWLAYKLAYVGIALGLIMGVAGMAMDNVGLAEWGWMMCAVMGSLGLMLRFYVWAIMMGGSANIEDQESEDSGN